MTVRQPMTLAILCGGESKRLGADKGLFQPLGDETLICRAIRLWHHDFAEVLVVTRQAAQAEAYMLALTPFIQENQNIRIRIVHDQMVGGALPNIAALIGVYSALVLAEHDQVVVAPVDQVGLRALHLRKLQGWEASDADVCRAFQRAPGGLLPFPSAWSKRCLPSLSHKLLGESFGVTASLKGLEASGVDPGDYGPELDLNCNNAADFADYFGEPLLDPASRRLHYLRFSLTEACNLSCHYCLPTGFPEWYRHKARLSLPDIQVLLSGFRRLGFRKVRFTGGEPTVHPKCLEAVRMARAAGYEDIAMTTNALLIRDLDQWLDAGLTQLNISLDSVDAEQFFAMTGSREVAKVLRVIDEAVARRVPVKINTVLMRSRNGDQASIARLIDWALARPVSLRFIELMETKLNGSFAGGERVLGSDIEPLLRARGLFPEQDSLHAPNLRGPASDYAASSFPGKIGLINPMSCNFCSKCNRLRITAKGQLKLCLFGDQDIPLDLSSAEAVALNVRRLIGRKPERHYLEDGNVGNVATFRTIGG